MIPAWTTAAPSETMAHPARVVAELRVRGTSTAAIARECGVTRTAVSRAIRYPVSRRIEAAVARALGVHPRRIWPDRYPARRGRKEAA